MSSYSLFLTEVYSNRFIKTFVDGVVLVCIVHFYDLLSRRNKSISRWDPFQGLAEHVLASLLTKFALRHIYSLFAASIGHVEGFSLFFEWILINRVVHFLHIIQKFLIYAIFISTCMVPRNRFKSLNLLI